MKVDKKKFIEAINYLHQINKKDLRDLDLSEFGVDVSLKAIEDWKFTGLVNTYFIRNLVFYGRVPRKKSIQKLP
jgi:hypothetical protein